MKLPNTPAIEYTTDLWEAWIDRQTIGSTTVQMLFVLGEAAPTINYPKPQLIRKHAYTLAKELHLEIVTDASPQLDAPTEVFYSEVLSNKSQYQCIKIFVGKTLVTTIYDIELIDSTPL